MELLKTVVLFILVTTALAKPAGRSGDHSGMAQKNSFSKDKVWRGNGLAHLSESWESSESSESHSMESSESSESSEERRRQTTLAPLTTVTRATGVSTSGPGAITGCVTVGIPTVRGDALTGKQTVTKCID